MMDEIRTEETIKREKRDLDEIGIDFITYNDGSLHSKLYDELELDNAQNKEFYSGIVDGLKRHGTNHFITLFNTITRTKKSDLELMIGAFDQEEDMVKGLREINITDPITQYGIVKDDKDIYQQWKLDDPNIRPQFRQIIDVFVTDDMDGIRVWDMLKTSTRKELTQTVKKQYFKNGINSLKWAAAGSGMLYATNFTFLKELSFPIMTGIGNLLLGTLTAIGTYQAAKDMYSAINVNLPETYGNPSSNV